MVKIVNREEKTRIFSVKIFRKNKRTDVLHSKYMDSFRAIQIPTIQKIQYHPCRKSNRACLFLSVELHELLFP
jgi:hypothetical protein